MIVLKEERQSRNLRAKQLLLTAIIHTDRNFLEVLMTIEKERERDRESNYDCECILPKILEIKIDK